MNDKVSTGILELNQILLGGLIPNRCYLMIGSPGTGKTILSMQWLIKSRRQNDNCLYISLTEAKDELISNARIFNWNLNGIDLIDLIQTESIETPLLEEYHVFEPDEVEQIDIWKNIYQGIMENKPNLVVIDSVSQLRFLSTDNYQFRKKIMMLSKFLNSRNITSILIFDPTEMEQHPSISLAADGIIHLIHENSPENVVGLRYLEIIKMRGTDFLSGFHPFKITPNGIKIFPHLIEEPGHDDLIQEQIISGITGLDEMLGGGIEIGTTTLISGPTGSGKSTLALRFLVESANKGMPGLIIMFDESREFIIYRFNKIGLPIESLLENKMLNIIRINPMQTYPDELLNIIRGLIDTENYKHVIIDSLQGYTLAMQQFGINTLIPHLHNLVTYLDRKKVTTFLINEMDPIISNMTITDPGLGHFSDNIILIRLFEIAGKVTKVIGCLKKRIGNFQPESRELIINNNGISLSDKLKEGILNEKVDVSVDANTLEVK